MDSILNTYKEVFHRIVSDWKQLSVWTVLFGIVSTAFIYSAAILLNTGIKWLVALRVGESGDIPSLTALGFFLITGILGMFLPLSWSHLVLNSDDPDYEGSLKLGTYGFRHPLQSIQFSIVWFLIAFIPTAGVLALLILFGSFTPLYTQNEPPIIVKICAGIGLIFAMAVFLFSQLSAFNMAADTNCMAKKSIARSSRQIMGKGIKFAIFLLPCILVFALLGGAVYKTEAAASYRSNLINEFAKLGADPSIKPDKGSVNGDDEWANLMKDFTFHDKKPECDIKESSVCRHEMAEFWAKYQEFKAKQNRKPVPKEVKDYRDTDYSILFRILWVLLLIMMYAVALYGTGVFAELYRATEELTKDPEPEDKEKQQNAKPELAVNAQATASPVISRTVVDAPKTRTPVDYQINPSVPFLMPVVNEQDLPSNNPLASLPDEPHEAKEEAAEAQPSQVFNSPISGFENESFNTKEDSHSAADGIMSNGEFYERAHDVQRDDAIDPGFEFKI